MRVGPGEPFGSGGRYDDLLSRFDTPMPAAGFGLDLDNLALFHQLPHLDEASIGHALISHALYVGLDRAVRDYIAALRG